LTFKGVFHTLYKITIEMTILQTKHYDFELKEETAGTGQFTGYASIFGNVDHDGDIIIKGAFSASLKKRTPKLLYQHNQMLPIGLVKAKEDATGLYVECDINLELETGSEVYSNLKKRILDKMSIGYKVVDSEFDSKTGVRTIKQLDLYEVSIVTFPANDLASVEDVKSSIEGFSSLADVEKFLREVKSGLSHNEAKHFISKFKSLLQRDVVEKNKKEAQEILEFIKNLTINQ